MQPLLELYPARTHQFSHLETGSAWYVTSNASSQTSGGWCMWYDDTMYVISWDSSLMVPPYKRVHLGVLGLLLLLVTL